MKELRNRVLEHLKRPDVSAGYYSAANVYKSACLGYIPTGVTFPCVGVLDGDTEYEYPDGAGAVRRQLVDIVIDMPLSGDDQSLETILDAADHIRQGLTDNPLDLDDVETALPLQEAATTLTDGPGGLTVRRILTMGYTRTD